MIAKTSESTVSSSSEVNLKTQSKDDALFYQLDPSELLKHLLTTSNGETVQCDSQSKKVNQSSKNGFTVTQTQQINAASRFENCDSTSCDQPHAVETAQAIENGSMETCGETRADLCECEVQSFGEPYSGFELPSELLENEALEFIFLEAQKSMCGESPPSSSESWEFTELQNVAPGPALEEVDVLGSTVTEDKEQNRNRRLISGGDSAESDNSDDDVDEAMVLVPAGKFYL